MNVSWGADPKSYKALDRPRVRSPRDILRMSTKDAAVIQFLIYLSVRTTQRFSPDISRLVHDHFAPEMDMVPPTSTVNIGKAAVRSAVILRIVAGADPEEIVPSWLKMVRNEQQMPPRLFQLRQQLIAGRTRGSGAAFTELDYFCRTWAAFEPPIGARATFLVKSNEPHIAAARAAIKARCPGLKDKIGNLSALRERLSRERGKRVPTGDVKATAIAEDRAEWDAAPRW
jgi:hypothetical protein